MLFFIFVPTNVGKYHLQDQLGLLGLSSLAWAIGQISGELRLTIYLDSLFNFASLPLSFIIFFFTNV